MISKGRKKGTVRFAYRPGNGSAAGVKVAGDFNNWSPQTMRRQKNGEYVAICPVDQPDCEYKFLVDQDWTIDPDNHCSAPNPFGTINSVVHLD